MNKLVEKIAELLADTFWFLMSPSRHADWTFERDECKIRVTVEIVKPKYEADAFVAFDEPSKKEQLILAVERYL